ncbi:TusE/DsrC/DsvC family sulfur relay protein, partial [Pseudomonas saponiphila]
MVNPLQFNGAEIARDHQGYLKNLNDWQPDMALLLAAEEQIVLTPAHWEVIN